MLGAGMIAYYERSPWHAEAYSGSKQTYDVFCLYRYCTTDSTAASGRARYGAKPKHSLITELAASRMSG